MKDFKYISEKVIKAFPFVKRMEDREIKKLIESSELMIKDKDTIVARDDEKCTGTILMLGGVLRLYKISEDGKEMTIYRVKKGEICVLTMYCILGNTDYPLIAEVEEQVTYLHIPSGLIKELIFNNKIWQEYIFSTMSKRLAEMLVIIEEVAFRNMNTRLVKFLINKSKENLDGVLKTTHEKIAADLGTDRVVISRLLKSFENKGVLKLSRGKIIIENIKLLENDY